MQRESARVKMVGGTAAAGGIKSDSGAVGTHRIQGPNGNSHFGGFVKR